MSAIPDDDALRALRSLEVPGGDKWQDMPKDVLLRALSRHGIDCGARQLKRWKRAPPTEPSVPAAPSASPLSTLADQLARDEWTRERFASHGMLRTLEHMARGQHLHAMMQKWAPGRAGQPWEPKYKRRSLDTALSHLGELRNQPPPRCVILGDSLSERLRADDSHRPGPHTCRQLQGEFAAAMGGAFIHSVGGDGVEHVLFRLLLTFDLCFAASVSTVVVLVGINNLLGAPQKRAGVEAEGATATPEAVAAGIQRLVRCVRGACEAAGNAGVEVVVCRGLPVSARFPDAEPVNRKVEELNERIGRLEGCRVVATQMDRTRSALYLADQLHLSDAGAALLTAQLLEHVPALAPGAPAAPARAAAPPPPPPPPPPVGKRPSRSEADAAAGSAAEAEAGAPSSEPKRQKSWGETRQPGAGYWTDPAVDLF